MDFDLNITPSSDAQKVTFVLCKNEAQRNAQNKGRFLGQLQRLVYAQHGRELMRCKSSVGEPTWFILSQYNY